MTKIITILIGALMLPGFAFGGTTADVSKTKQILDNTPPGAKVRLGTKMTQEVVQVARARYSFAVQGGAIGAINLLDDEGKAFKLPNKAVITNVLIDVATQPTSGGAATIAIGANTASDIKAATAIASYTGILAAVPVNTAATAIKLTADRTLTMTVATAALTAGKFVVLVEYYLSQ